MSNFGRSFVFSDIFFSGKYQSVLEQSTHCNFWRTPDLSFINGLCYKAMPGTGWSLESLFLGLNAIVNSFWRFQHETINILYIFCISGIIGIILLFIVVNLIDPDDYYLNHNLNPNIPILIYYPCFLLLGFLFLPLLIAAMYFWFTVMGRIILLVS